MKQAALIIALAGALLFIVYDSGKNAKKLETALSERDAQLAASVSIIDAERGMSATISAYDKLLQEKLNEIDRDSAPVIAGDKRVYVRAECPEPGSLPDAAGAEQLARLKREHERIIFDQRRRIAQWEKNRDVCLAYFAQSRSMAF